jgi:hypothetical protein
MAVKEDRDKEIGGEGGASVVGSSFSLRWYLHPLVPGGDTTRE